MAHRLIFGLLFAAALSGCGGSDGSETASGTTNAASPANTVTGSITSTTTTPSSATTPSSTTTPASATVPSSSPTPSSSPPASGAPSSSGTPVAAAAPTIGGTPATAVLAGAAYAFTPTTAPGATGLTFNVANLPGWAQFNSRTGELSGTPSSADVGSFANIVISVSDGNGQASLPPFSIAVTQSASGSATLNWTPPTENTDGTPVTNLSGYRIYYGNSAAAINESIQVANAGIATYVVTNLSPGTWYFEVRAYNAANMESSPSAVASKMIN